MNVERPPQEDTALAAELTVSSLHSMARFLETALLLHMLNSEENKAMKRDF